MTDTRPSPAPWAYEYSPYTIGAAGDREIAVEARELPAYEIFDADGTKLFDTNENTDGALQEANARLATAAPDLLAACQMIISRWDRGDLAEAARVCQAAVELAIGGSPPWDITDAKPATRSQKITSTLLKALEEIIDYAENEAYCLENLKDSPEAEAEAERAWQAVEAARDAIAQAKGVGAIPMLPETDVSVEA